MPLKLLALALSIIFWVFVVSVRNVFATLPDNVPVMPTNLADNLALSENLPGVKVTVQSENADFFRSLGPADFEATVDLGDLGEGDHTVKVSARSLRPDVHILRISPEDVTVTLEPVREEILSLAVVVDGSPQQGYEVVSTKPSVDFVRVKGAESVLKSISEANVVVTLTGTETKALQRKAEVVLLDQSGKEVENVDLETREVFVDLDIEQVNAQKQAAIHAALQGNPASGSLQAVTITPSTVLVEGEKSAIEGLTFIETEPINLSTVSQTVTLSRKLVIPDGIKLIDLPSGNVSVKIEIAP